MLFYRSLLHFLSFIIFSFQIQIVFHFVALYQILAMIQSILNVGLIRASCSILLSGSTSVRVRGRTAAGTMTARLAQQSVPFGFETVRKSCCLLTATHGLLLRRTCAAPTSAPRWRCLAWSPDQVRTTSWSVVFILHWIVSQAALPNSPQNSPEQADGSRHLAGQLWPCCSRRLSLLTSTKNQLRVHLAQLPTRSLIIEQLPSLPSGEAVSMEGWSSCYVCHQVGTWTTGMKYLFNLVNTLLTA